MKTSQVTTWSCHEIVDNILHEDKLPIVQPTARHFYVFTSPQHSCLPVQVGGAFVRQKNIGRPSFMVDHHAQILWIVTSNHEIIGISST